MVIFANEAKADLKEIGDYIAQNDPHRAISFIEEMIDCCEMLELRPHAYAIVPRFAHLGFRKRTFGNYLIFYRVLDGQVEVARILNAARDYDALLIPEND
jgi:addiction module RelE/StbE family toxin